MLPQEYREDVVNRCHEPPSFYENPNEGTGELRVLQESYVYAPRHEVVEVGTMPIPPQPLHTWSLDLIGPMPEGTGGNKYLLICVEHLTDWAEAFPIPDKTSDCVVHIHV